MFAKPLRTRKTFQDVDQPSLEHQRSKEQEGVPRRVEGGGWIAVCNSLYVLCTPQLVQFLFHDMLTLT
jgi:hypothetical protein